MNSGDHDDEDNDNGDDDNDENDDNGDDNGVTTMKMKMMKFTCRQIIKMITTNDIDDTYNDDNDR